MDLVIFVHGVPVLCKDGGVRKKMHMLPSKLISMMERKECCFAVSMAMEEKKYHSMQNRILLLYSRHNLNSMIENMIQH